MNDIDLLTQWFFQDFLTGNASDSLQPVLQIAESRMMGSSGYRLRLSDGKFIYSSCMTIPNLSERFLAEKLNNGCAIIRVTEWAKSDTNNKVFFSVNDYELVKKVNEVVGNPTMHTGNTEEFEGIARMQLPSTVHKRPSVVDNGPSPKRPQPATPQPTTPQMNTVRKPVGQPETPIGLITPYINRFRIRGIISEKDKEIREINNAKGVWRLFNFNVTDNAGSSIRITAFGEQADKFHPIIENGHVYYISGSGKNSIRPATKQYNQTGHDYEITLPRDTEMEICFDQLKEPVFKVNPVPLKMLSARSGDHVDILAIVDKIGEPATVTKRATGEPLTKRDITLVDKSGTEVIMTLWGDQARDLDSSQLGVAIAMKGAMVKEFNGGFTLSAPFSASNMKMNLNSSDTANLYNWHRNVRPTIDLTSLSTNSGGNFESEIRLIGMAWHNNFSKGTERGHYFFIKGSINQVKTENAVYKACAGEGCKKKAIEDNGHYTCSKCSHESDNYKNVMMLNVEVVDFTGSAWMMIFDERAEKLLNMKATNLAELQKDNPLQYDAVFDTIRFHSYVFRVRMHESTYNEEKRTKWDVQDIKPVSTFAEPYKRALDASIKAMDQM